MASNGSAPADLSAYAQVIFSQSVYIVEGLVTVYGNLLIVLAIALHPWLRRKELAAVAALALVDAMYGLGRLSSGVDRLSIVFRGAASNLVRARDCLTFGTATLVLGAQSSSIMMLVLSFDRLLAVARYARYLSFGRGYVVKLLTIPLVYMLGTVAFILYAPYNLVSEEYQFPAFCFGLWAFPKWYSLVVNGVILGGGYGSVILYLFVYIAFRKSTLGPADDATKKRQHRLTITLGIVTAATFILLCIPVSTIVVLGWIPMDPNIYGAATLTLYMINGLNQVVNVFIYLRNKEMSTAIACVMRFRRAKQANAVTVAPTVK